MTVFELIQELQDCDLPDAEVVVQTRGPIIETPFEVFYDDGQGPVYINVDGRGMDERT